jgi:hypothetical protein
MKLILILLILAAMVGANYIAARMLIDPAIRLWTVLSGFFAARLVGKGISLLYKSLASTPDPIVNDVLSFVGATITVFFFYRSYVQAETNRAWMMTFVYAVSSIVALIGMSFIATP